MPAQARTSAAASSEESQTGKSTSEQRKTGRFPAPLCRDGGGHHLHAQGTTFPPQIRFV